MVRLHNGWRGKMILNTLKSLEGITEVKPHSLRKKLPEGKLSNKMVQQLVDFAESLNAKIIELSSKENVSKEDLLNELSEYGEKFKQIRGSIAAEIPDKKGNMRVIPREYVEVIYILTYQMVKYLNLAQSDIAKLFGLLEKDFKDRWGISPASDYKIKHAEYHFALPSDTNTDILKDLVPYIGSYLADVSYNYIIGVSNKMSLFANLENTNKSSTRKKKGVVLFYGRQFYCNITSIQDLYDWVFIEYIPNNVVAVKEKVQSLLCTDNVEMNENLLKFLLTSGIEIKAENINENDYKGFQLKYEEYLAKVKDKELWEEVLENPEIPYDDLMVDMKDWKAEDAVDHEEYCKKQIRKLNKNIDKDLQKLMVCININSFRTDDTVRIYRYLVKSYTERLENFTPELFEDKTSFCAMYLFSRYFSQNGVSDKTIEDLKKYLVSSKMSAYVNRYINDYISAFKDGVDINDNIDLLGKVSTLNEVVKSRKENRTIVHSVVMIDADCYPVDSDLVDRLSETCDNLYIIIISSQELDLPSLIKENINSTYIYTTEREKA